MFTRQWNAWLYQHFTLATSRSVAYSYKGIDGSSFSYIASIQQGQSSSNYRNLVAGDNNYEALVLLGGGDTPPTYDDYRLENGFYQDPTRTSPLWELDITTIDTQFELVNDGLRVTYTLSVTNVTNTQQVIKEYGLRSTVSPNVSTTASAIKVLLFRELFDEPITIAAGDSKTIIITVTFPNGNVSQT